MKNRTLNGLICGLGASLLATAALAQGQTVNPKLAPGVKPIEGGYVADTEKMVVGNPTPLFGDVMFTANKTGELDKVDEPVNILAKVKNWDWVLVGQNGEGIGYAPIDLLKPAPGAKTKTKTS